MGEVTWFGNAPMETQLLDLYCLDNEKNKVIANVWDAIKLICTFQRTFSDRLMSQWFDLENIARSIRLEYQYNSLIW